MSGGPSVYPGTTKSRATGGQLPTPDAPHYLDDVTGRVIYFDASINRVRTSPGYTYRYIPHNLTCLSFAHRRRADRCAVQIDPRPFGGDPRELDRLLARQAGLRGIFDAREILHEPV